MFVWLQCLIFLDDPQAVAEILERLVRHDELVKTLMAYQIGFDLYESATQQFLKRIQDALRTTAPVPLAATGGADGAATEGKVSVAVTADDEKTRYEDNLQTPEGKGR